MIYMVETYAQSMQLRNYFTNKRPKALEKVKAIKDEDYKKGLEHSKDVLSFSMY